MVGRCLYTTLTNGGLDLRIQNYINAGPTISIIALDNVDNLTDETLLDNPYHSDEPDMAQPPTPIVIYTGDPNAQQPTQPSQGGQGTQSGGQTYPSGGQQTMQTPVQTVTPTPEPVSTVTPEPTAEPTPTSEPLEPYEGTGFTNSGQFITCDMLYDKFINNLFVTVETRDGSLFNWLWTTTSRWMRRARHMRRTFSAPWTGPI